MTRIVLVGNAYGCGLLVRGRLGTSRICAQDNRTTLAFDACRNRMHSTLAWAFRDTASPRVRIPRNTHTADAGICSWHDSLGMYRRKCIDAHYDRLHGTWYRRGSDTRSCFGRVLTRRIPCNTLGNCHTTLDPVACAAAAEPRLVQTKLRPQLSFAYAFLMQRPLQTPLMICQRPF